MPVKKTRTDAWESRLTPEESEKLYVLTGSLSYHAAKAVAKSELKVTLPSQATFYRFLERKRQEDAALRLAKAAQVSKEVTRLAKSGAVEDKSLVASLQSLGAEAALNGNLKDATRLVAMACDIARQSAKLEELRLAQEKLKIEQAKNAKAADAATDEKLTDAERVEKIKGIFGLK